MVDIAGGNHNATSSADSGSGSSPFRDLTFPLNVYAHALLLQEGTADYLHYGLFDQDARDMRAAQMRSTELVLAQLPPPPCRILEVGSGLGTMLSLLTDRGYDVHGITPDSRQVSHILKRFGGQVSVSCESLEDFDCEAAAYDVLLFQESSQYIDPLVIFNKALDLLVPSGSLLVIDEFAFRRTEPGCEGLHLYSDFMALSERFGFEQMCDTDLSKLAAPTLEYILKVVDTHRQALIDDLALDPVYLLNLDVSNEIYRVKYASGRFGYKLLHFRKGALPRWRLRAMNDACVSNFQTLFERCFGHAMPAALWNWKYGGGHGTGVGVWRSDGTLIAHYGGTSRDVLLFGQPAKAFQACDLMVDPGERGSLSRKGPVFLATATYLERELGYGKPHLLGIGFPNERAYRAPERLGLYCGCLGRIQNVTWPARRSRPFLLCRIREINVRAVASSVLSDRCWQAMAADAGGYVIGVRDSVYLQHRYANHPDKYYRIFIVSQRVTQRPLGLIVLRKTEEGSCELLDVIGELRNIPMLIVQAQRMAAMMGCATLFAWLVHNILSVFNLPKDANVLDMNILVPGNNWTAAPDNDLVREKWWLTGGDTDFH